MIGEGLQRARHQVRVHADGAAALVQAPRVQRQQTAQLGLIHEPDAVVEVDVALNDSGMSDDGLQGAQRDRLLRGRALRARTQAPAIDAMGAE